MRRRLAVYLSVSFLWTWGLWISAFLISSRAGFDLSTTATLFELFADFPERTVFLTQLIFALGVYGPMIGFLFASSKLTGSFFGRMRPGQAALYLAIPVAVALPGALMSSLFGYFNPNSGSAIVGAIVLYFVSNLVTSGTEEFGWRGFLYPVLRQGAKSLWNASWKSGLIWAVWHYPLMFFMYWESGPAALVPTLAGFTASIVAMAYITNYIFEKTHSIGLCMLVHALNNTLSFVMLLCFPKTPFSILFGFAVWVVVAILDKANQTKANSTQGA